MKISPKRLIRKNPFVLAPMDDVTDLAYRELSEKMGASYTVSELTSSDAFIRDKVYNSRFSRGNLKVNVVQFFGSDPDIFVEAAKKIEDDVDFIDINFGCPSASVNANDAGAILLKDPKNVSRIISTLVKHIEKPITAKIRLGYKKTTFMQVAKEIEDAGAELIAVHARTAEQKYSGKADWSAIRKIYENSKIPIIGNGDISKEEDIDKYLKTHADALMIGRAAIGNPYIFKRFSQYYKTGEKLLLDDNEKKKLQKKLFLSYLKRLEEMIDEGYDFKSFSLKVQRQAMWFMKGIEGAKKLRVNLMREKDIKNIIKLVEEF